MLVPLTACLCHIRVPADSVLVIRTQADSSLVPTQVNLPADWATDELNSPAEETLSQLMKDKAPEVDSEEGAAVIIDGIALQVLLDGSDALWMQFQTLACRCSSVVVCRVSPDQKAQVNHAVLTVAVLTVAVLTICLLTGPEGTSKPPTSLSIFTV